MGGRINSIITYLAIFKCLALSPVILAGNPRLSRLQVPGFKGQEHLQLPEQSERAVETANSLAPAEIIPLLDELNIYILSLGSNNIAKAILA
jgi:hypothetical protein